MYLIRIFIILFYFFLALPSIHANGDQCYLSVSINDQTIIEKSEDEYVEKEISLKNIILIILIFNYVSL